MSEENLIKKLDQMQERITCLEDKAEELNHSVKQNVKFHIFNKIIEEYFCNLGKKCLSVSKKHTEHQIEPVKEVPTSYSSQDIKCTKQKKDFESCKIQNSSHI